MNNFKIKGTGIVGYSWSVEKPTKVVCLIHGLGEHAGRYERVAGYLNKNGISLFSMDLRGHGKSDGKRGHCAPRSKVLNDVNMLIEHASKEAPHVPIILYGHSMGGNIVLNYRQDGELREFVKGYIISAPWIKLVNPPSKGIILIAKILSKLFPSLTVKSIVKEEELGNPKMVRPYNDDPLVHDKISFLTATDCTRFAEGLLEGYKKNNRKMLLMHGTKDSICSVDGAKEIALKEGEMCTFINWEGYFHEIHNGNNEVTGEKVILSIVDFIKSL